MSILYPTILLIGPEAACLQHARTNIIPLQTPVTHIWTISPDGGYTVDNAADIQYRTSFARSINEPFFVIITQAELFNNAAAHQLLKTLEEPSAGYQFILCTTTPELLLLTVRSRCVQIYIENSINTAHAYQDNSYFKLATEYPWKTRAQYAKILTASQVPEERETVVLAHAIMHYWLTHHHHNQLRTKMIQALEPFISNPPTPGSSILWWRTLMITITGIHA